MTESLRGSLDAGSLRIGVVRSLFNRPVTDGLLDGALAVLVEAGAADVTVIDVEGAFETPLVAQSMAQTGYDAIVVLGAVIEGETDHYEHIAGRTSDGLMRVMLDTGVPVSFGILTVRDPAHAFARSAPDKHNKGREAAEAAVRTANLLRQDMRFET
jgi:6,7-dimethyl-8-ribityllumazine synthase